MGSIVPPQSTNVALTQKTDYCRNMIYENGQLSKILTDVGYITLANSTPTYHHYLQDHLGNNRVVIDEHGQAEQVNHYYAFGGLMGESIGGGAQSYKYNYKELDRMHGLDWYDYGTRYYDAVLGRWMCVDPLAEKYVWTSPYLYDGGNPIRIIDPNGMGWVETVDKKTYWDERVNSAEDIKFIPKGGRFLGNTADLFDEQGIYKFGDNQGNILSAHPMENVIVTGDKDYKFHHSFGDYLFGDFRNSDGGYGPIQADAISFGVGGNVTFIGSTVGIEVGIIMRGGAISPYLTISGGIDAENIYDFFSQKGRINPLKILNANASGNFVMYENLKKNDLNSFDSYRGLGILNGLSVGNLGFLYGTSAVQGENGYNKTNLSKSYGVSLNANPARFDVSRGGGRTWIPFF